MEVERPKREGYAPMDGPVAEIVANTQPIHQETPNTIERTSLVGFRTPARRPAAARRECECQVPRVQRVRESAQFESRRLPSAAAGQIASTRRAPHRTEWPVRPCVVGSATLFMTNDDGLTWLSDRCSFCPSGLWHQPFPSDCLRAPQCRRPTRTECQTARSASSSYSGV